MSKSGFLLYTKNETPRMSKFELVVDMLFN